MIACASCGTFAAELEHDGTPLCQLCGHAVIAHGAKVTEAWRNECECTAEEIYPDGSLRAVATHTEDLTAWAAGRCCRLVSLNTGCCPRH